MNTIRTVVCGRSGGAGGRGGVDYRKYLVALMHSHCTLLITSIIFALLPRRRAQTTHLQTDLVAQRAGACSSSSVCARINHTAARVTKHHLYVSEESLNVSLSRSLALALSLSLCVSLSPSLTTAHSDIYTNIDVVS